MNNYRDISTPMGDMSAGFQFEFYCESCDEVWRTPFKPYRAGQAAGLFRRFSSIFNEFYKTGALTDLAFKAGRASGTSAEMAGSKAKVGALEEAQAMAASRYEKCTSCHTMVCGNCWRGSSGLCIKCDAQAGVGTASAQASPSAGALACPNCQTPSQGGRFCHECGFDMASTHKSCPACGTTLPRAARFCTDCGHGF